MIGTDTRPCPTCDGTGISTYRGAARHGYDEPDYEDACGICGGSGELPAAMFTNDGDEPEDECDGWDDEP